MASGSGSNGTAVPSSNANDCLALLSKAVSSPDPSDRKRLLARLVKVLETSPGFLPILYGTFMGMLGGPVGSEGAVRRWVVDIMELAVCRGIVGPDQRMQLAVQSVEPLFRLMNLNDTSDSSLADSKKIAIQVFSSAYPLIFRHAVASNSTSASATWGLVQQLKGQILALWRNEAASLGVRVSATKSVQRVIQVGTKAGGDPRRRAEDPNVTMIPNNHPFLKSQELQTEATGLLEEAVRLLYTSRSPDLVSALITALGLLIRVRVSHANLVITALASWTPSTLAAPVAGAPPLSYTQLRGPEKTLRIALSYIDRTAHQYGLSSYANQIREALIAQAHRMDRAAEEARAERERAATLKRQRIVEDAESAGFPGGDPNKRPRHAYDLPQQGMDAPAMVASGSGQGARAPLPPPTNLLPGFDVRTLPVELVAELIIANFQVMTDATLQDALARIRQTMAQEGQVTAAAADDDDEEELEFKEPPRMDADVKSGRALEGKPDEAEAAAEEEAEAALMLEAFELPPPEPLSDEARSALMRSTLERLAGNGMEWMKGRLGGVDAATGAGALVNELWVAMLSRLATRGLVSDEDEDQESQAEAERRREAVRKVIYDFIVSDLKNRMEFARVWLNEEWYSTRARSPPVDSADSPYGAWLRRLLDHIVEHSSAQDRSFSTFLIDLPEVPKAEVRRLESMCNNSEQLQNGFTTLRELAMLRPPIRQEAMDVLLGLTTHSAKQTRNAAIVTVKSWVPETEPLASQVVAFALQLLDRLQSEVKPEVEDVKMAEVNGTKKYDDGELEAGEEPPEVVSCGLVEDSVVVSGLPAATTQEAVRQHLELLFALSVKSPELLDALFVKYGSLPAHVQEAIPVLIAPLIRSLGAKHPKVVELIQSCPAGSQDLVLRMLGVLTEKSRPPPIVVEAIKALAADQPDLSPRFIVPIIAELDKPDILKHLPRILTLLDGTAAQKTLVRTIFEGIIEMPPQNFGSVSTNAPRVKQSELLSPVELLALLHRSEKDTGLKQAIEAIGICFSMTDVFRPEVLAAFMQQVVDELTLPTLFLRTVIQAVQTYKSLQAFVSTTLLSRLIIKKIWTQPQLWEGFIRCAKTIAPHSFGALLQLPREQLREVVAKQPALKVPLRDYVIKKAGNNRARVAPMLEILSDQATPPPQPLQGMSPAPNGEGTQPVQAMG